MKSKTMQLDNMSELLKVEELFMAILGIYLYSTLDFAWWIFFVLLFLPDLSMLGYLINPRVGALSYNLFHHKAAGVIIFLLGLVILQPYFQLIGVMLFTHSSMDRVLGYGLKFSNDFRNTHLGRLG